VPATGGLGVGLSSERPTAAAMVARQSCAHGRARHSCARRSL
jgi:hypothetical protein